jgi:hypothetical protein
MRNITKAEIEEYLRFAFATADQEPANAREQALLIGDCLAGSKLLKAASAEAVEGMRAGQSAEDFIISFWVSAFQMGREFESRLFTAALKAGRLDPGEPIPGIH